MQVKLKLLSEQTIIITGATSGIGLCTARMAAALHWRHGSVPK